MKKEQNTKGVGKLEYDHGWILEEEEEATTAMLIPAKYLGCCCYSLQAKAIDPEKQYKGEEDTRGKE